jgi:hypothetical protein
MLIREKGDLGIERTFLREKKNGEWKLVMQGFNPHYSGTTDSAVQLWNMNVNPYRPLITGIPGTIFFFCRIKYSTPHPILCIHPV